MEGGKGGERERERRQSNCRKASRSRTRRSGPGDQDQEVRTRRSGPGDQDLEIRTWRSGPGDQDLEIRTWRSGPGGQDQEIRTRRSGPGAARSSMSESMRRKSSSRQLLQNLISVTAERSQEDAEEVERERRRRSRESQRGEGGPSPCPSRRETQQRDELTAHSVQVDEELKPRSNLVQEEDEGFSDWSHRLENRGEQEVQDVSRRPLTRRKPQPGEEERQGEDQEEKEGQGCHPERSSRSKEASSRLPEKMTCDREEVRMSYSSTVFLSPDARLQQTDRTSYLETGTMRPRRGRADGETEQEELQEVQAALQRESAERSSRDKGDHEEEPSFRREEEDCLYLRVEEEEEEEVEGEEKHRMADKSWMKSGRGEEARRRREETSRRSGRSEETSRRSEETNRSEEAPRRSEETIRRSEEARSEETPRSEETRKSDEAGRRSASSLAPFCSSDGEESLNYGPMSPTFKKLLIQFYPDEVNSRVSTDGKCSIIERTESLRKSTSHIKKTSPVAVSKIDKKLELYAQAVEVSSKDGRPEGQAPTELTSPAEPVSSKKSLFEAADTWRHDAPPGAPSKDADGLKVGVANLINQWVRGSEGGSRCSSPCGPAESSPGKRFKFVVTGHGKYEKVPVEDCREEAHCPPAGHVYEDL
ncbi:uncharacterized protein AB9W97_011440 isoform 2-T2 [Spinachia spinachia]